MSHLVFKDSLNISMKICCVFLTFKPYSKLAGYHNSHFSNEETESQKKNFNLLITTQLYVEKLRFKDPRSNSQASVLIPAQVASKDVSS